MTTIASLTLTDEVISERLERLPLTFSFGESC